MLRYLTESFRLFGLFEHPSASDQIERRAPGEDLPLVQAVQRRRCEEEDSPAQ